MGLHKGAYIRGGLIHGGAYIRGGLIHGRFLYLEVYGMYGFHDFQCIVFPCSSQINKKITHYIGFLMLIKFIYFKIEKILTQYYYNCT